jgi:hypothetical protein
VKQVELEIVEGLEGGHAVAPAHYANVVRVLLDETFTLRWTGTNGWAQWPPCSPDLISLNSLSCSV